MKKRTFTFARLAALGALPFAIWGSAAGFSAAAFGQSGDEAVFDLGSAEAVSLAGSWALKIDETIIFRFDIARDDSKWSGTWLRPDSFASDGNAFARLKGPVERVPSMAGLNFAGLVELSFDDPRPDAIPDIFRFRLLDKNSAELSYVGTDLAPYNLVRVDKNTAMGDWSDAVIYRRPLPDDGFGDIEVVDHEDINIPAAPDQPAASDQSASAMTGDGDKAEEAAAERPRIEADFLEGL